MRCTTEYKSKSKMHYLLVVASCLIELFRQSFREGTIILLMTKSFCSFQKFLTNSIKRLKVVFSSTRYLLSCPLKR